MLRSPAAQLFADRFAIEQEAGVGNMGIVYRAIDRMTGALVALKVLHEHRAPEIGRFVSELSVLGAIRHPAIIPYLSHGITIDDERFLVTEWTEGETLAARLVRENLSVASTLVLGYRIADGLVALHAAGVVHGDLRPSNVFLPRMTDGSSTPHAKLIDFGLPSPFVRKGPATGEDARSDLFALGAVLLQALTGVASILDPSGAARTNEPGWLRALRSEAPMELEMLLEHLLEQDARERPEDIVKVRDALGAISKEYGPSLTTDPAGPKTLSSAPSVLPHGERGERARPNAVRISGADESELVQRTPLSDRIAAQNDAALIEGETAPARTPSDSDRVLRAGMTFAGRYLLEARVGVGGMGELFRAFDTRLRRTVALKVLHRDRAIHAPSESSARILREARAAASLSHANVVAIHDVGEHEGVPFIAMEYVEGQSLRAFVGASYPPLETRLGWMVDVARALGAAHEKGLVHRDVKPDNVMIREDGTVKVLDFGIARYREGLPDIRLPPEGTDDETSDLAIAATNTRVVGTPGYMAPEQTRGDRIDGRADQFSWGVVAFEVFSGAMPWPMKRGGLSIAAAALSEQAKPLGDAVPARVAQVIQRTLSKNETERFPSMRDVVSALGASPDVSGNLPAAPSPPRKSPIEISDSPRSPSPLVPVMPGNEPDAQKDEDDELPPESRSWLSGRRSTLLVAALFMLMIATVLAGRAALRRKGPIPPPMAAVTPAPSETSIVALPASPKCSPASVAHYRDGLSALREANWELAYTAFTQATVSDPACPEAQLRRVFTGTWYEPIVKQREHFRLAAELRDALSERDRVLFDSLLPLIILDPPDRDVSARILDAGLERFPGDAELLLTSAAVRMNLALEPAELEHELELAKRATDIDAKYADAWQHQGRILARLGRLDDELSALDACLRASPGASDCMHDRVLILRWRGHCSEIATETRRWIARAPTSGSAYWQLALALAEEGAPDDTIEEAVRQQLSHQPEEHHVARWLYAMARLAAYRGDFEKVEHLTGQLAKQSSSDPALTWHLRPALLQMETAEEVGRIDRASAIAEPFLRRHTVWAVGDPTLELTSYEPAVLGVLLRGGRIPQSEWRARTTLWENRVAPRMGSLDAWGFTWGPVSDSRELAQEAWRMLPTLPERASALIGFNTFDLRAAEIQRGRLALRAGEYARAVDILAPVAKTCLSFEQPFASTRAHLWLGEAKEHTGDKSGACDAYRHVLHRWGAAKPASKSADEARKRARALGCTLP